MSAIEIAGAIITVVSIWLATRESLWYYPTGIASVLLYAWIYAQARLYAESGLQFVWLGLMIYGWWAWMRGGEERRELPVSRTPRRAWPLVLGAAIAMSVITTLLQRRYTNNPAPLIDSSIAGFSIVAQAMTARKWIENWLFWIVINVVSIYLYLSRDLYPTAALYVVLLILGIAGYRKWQKSLASA